MTTLDLRHMLVPFLALSVACSGGGAKDDTGDTTGDDTDETCSSGLDGFWPEPNASDVYYRTSIEVMFAQEEDGSSATITLNDGSADVTGTVEWSDDGMTAYFKPSAPLTPSTTYTLSVSYSCGKSATNSFTTSSTGATVDGMSVIDDVYSIDLFSGRIIEPAGVEDLLQSLLAGEDPIIILVSPTTYDGDANTIEIRGALGKMNGSDIVQDECTESINFPLPADYSNNPYFTINGVDVPLSVQGISLKIDRLDVSGAFASDGSSIDGVSVDAFADTRPLASLGVGDICELVQIAQVECVPCADNEPACLKIRVTDLTAEQVDGLMGLNAITADDVTNNPTCDE